MLKYARVLERKYCAAEGSTTLSDCLHISTYVRRNLFLQTRYQINFWCEKQEKESVCKNIIMPVTIYIRLRAFFSRMTPTSNAA